MQSQSVKPNKLWIFINTTVRTSYLEKKKLYAFTPWWYMGNWKRWYISLVLNFSTAITTTTTTTTHTHTHTHISIYMRLCTNYPCTSTPCSRDIEAWNTTAKLHVNWSTEEYLPFCIGGESDWGSCDISDWDWLRGYGLERLAKGHYIRRIKYALLHIHTYTYLRVVNFSEYDTVFVL